MPLRRFIQTFLITGFLLAGSGQLCAAETGDSTLPAIEALGQQLYRQDTLVGWATDFLMDKHLLQDDKRITGWVVETLPKGAAVHFMGRSGDSLAIFHSVLFDANDQMSYSNHEQPAPDVQHMFTARETALTHLALGCPGMNYNTVVLPSATGWTVYVLGSTDTPGVVVAGGHNRIELSPDGNMVLSSLAMANDCLQVNPPPGSQSADGVIIRDDLHESPVETQVWLSLLQPGALFVVTLRNATVWQLDQGRITKVQQGRISPERQTTEKPLLPQW